MHLCLVIIPMHNIVEKRLVPQLCWQQLLKLLKLPSCRCYPSLDIDDTNGLALHIKSTYFTFGTIQAPLEIACWSLCIDLCPSSWHHYFLVVEGLLFIFSLFSLNFVIAFGEV